MLMLTSMNPILQNVESGFCAHVSRYGKPGGSALLTALTRSPENAAPAASVRIAIRLFDRNSEPNQRILCSWPGKTERVAKGFANEIAADYFYTFTPLSSATRLATAMV
jgi:hypothetical protein